jgi:hypothetical protein
MQNFLKLAENTDIGMLLHAIRRQPELWNRYDVRKTFNMHSVHKIADDILLRYNKYEAGEDLAEKSCTELEAVDYPAFSCLPEARSLIFALMARVQGERLGRCLIASLPPGVGIGPHTDIIPPCSEAARLAIPPAVYYERYHIVLQSNPGAIFRCGSEQVHMATGEVWWFNNTIEHEVINNSNDDRIHLIVDIKCATKFWTPPE